MDQGCQDIPMRLDIEHQPLNFDIYLEQVIDIPQTSIDQPPYDFHLELEALNRVDEIIERTLNNSSRIQNNNSDQKDDPLTCPDRSPLLRFKTSATSPTTTTTLGNEQCNSQSEIEEKSCLANEDIIHRNPVAHAAMAPPPSCPMEVPLTPIKCFIEPCTNNSNSSNTTTAAQATTATMNSNSNSNSNSGRSTINQINPLEFEEMHYNPFDHLELQTIDERKELDLVFQASYANRASKQ